MVRKRIINQDGTINPDYRMIKEDAVACMVAALAGVPLKDYLYQTMTKEQEESIRLAGWYIADQRVYLQDFNDRE